MGFYATTTALSARMPDLELDTATTALVSACIDDAEAEVNKYLSRRYSLASFQTTTAAIPPIMRAITVKLSEGYLWQRNSRGAKESLARGNSLEKGALLNLKDITEYQANLVDTAGALILDDANNSAYRVLCNTSGYEPTFNEGPSLDWGVDQDKIDDIEDGTF